MQARRENGAACVAALDEEFAKRTFAEWKEVLSASTRPGPRCSPFPSFSTIPR